MEFLKNIIWGYCGWETAAIIFVIAAISIFLIRRYQLNKEIKKLKNQL